MIKQLIITLVFISISLSVMAGNGCGSGWNKKWVKDNYGSANFLYSCTVHDACYDACGSNQSNCDKQFRVNLKRECNSTFNAGNHEIQRKGCLKIADGYYESVKRLGSSSYKKAQRDAQCSSNTQNSCTRNDSKICSKQGASCFRSTRVSTPRGGLIGESVSLCWWEGSSSNCERGGIWSTAANFGQKFGWSSPPGGWGQCMSQCGNFERSNCNNP